MNTLPKKSLGIFGGRLGEQKCEGEGYTHGLTTNIIRRGVYVQSRLLYVHSKGHGAHWVDGTEWDNGGAWAAGRAFQNKGV